MGGNEELLTKQQNKTMQIEEIKAALRQYIREQFNVPAEDKDFNDDVHLFDYGYVDSFGAVTLTTFVKDQFGVEISNSDLVAYPLNTIQEIAEFVAKRKKGEV